jgi:hypothetical protein
LKIQSKGHSNTSKFFWFCAIFIVVKIGYLALNGPAQLALKYIENFSSDPSRFFYTPLKSNIGPQNGTHLATFIAVFTNHDAEKSRFIETVMYGSRFLRTATLLYVYEAETQLITCHHFQTSSPHYIKSSKNQIRFSPFC